MPKPKNSIPKRWLPYTSIGKKVPQTRFIAFKAPLREEMCRNLPEDQRFTLQHLVENVKKLGLIIDLTNTNRFYNATDLDKWNIQYSKIYVEGKKVPNSFIVKQFFEVVDEFLKKRSNKGKLIGVHCTHGLNRTGYLVCRYMVDKLNKTPDDAVNAFNEARGHCMERPAYIRGLSMDPVAAEKLIVEDHRRGNSGPRPQFYPPQQDYQQFQNTGHFHHGYRQNVHFNPHYSHNSHSFHPFSQNTPNDIISRRGRRNANNSDTRMNPYSNYDWRQGDWQRSNWQRTHWQRSNGQAEWSCNE